MVCSSAKFIEIYQVRLTCNVYEGLSTLEDGTMDWNVYWIRLQ